MHILSIRNVRLALRDCARGGWKTWAMFSDDHTIGPLRFNHAGDVLVLALAR